MYRHRQQYTRKSGGIALLIKDTLSDHVKLLKGNDHEYVLWCKLEEAVIGCEVIIGAVYIPPGNSNYFIGDEFNLIANDVIDLNAEYNCPILLIGDFNARSGKMKDYVTLEKCVVQEAGLPESENDLFCNSEKLSSLNILTHRVNSDTKCDNNGHKLVDMCKNTGLLIVNGRVGQDSSIGKTTCKSVSTIDYVISSVDLFPYIQDMGVDCYDPLLSDVHNPIFVELTRKKNSTSANDQMELPLPCEPSPGVPKLKNNWDSNKKEVFKKAFNMQAINHLCKTINNTQSYSVNELTIDNLAKDICNVYKEAGCESGVIKLLNRMANGKNCLKRKQPRKPWFTHECEIKRKAMFRAKNIARKSGSILDKKTYKMKSREFKKSVNTAHGLYHRELHNNIRKMRSSKPKDFWNLLNKACNQREKTAPIPVNDFLEHFKNLSSEEQDQTEQTSTPLPQQGDPFLNAVFTEREISHQLTKLKNGKAAGVDMIINEFIKNSPPEMLTLLVKFFNLILETGIIPADWTVGIIIPIYKKKGSPTDPDNYRGITLLSCISKLFTALLNQRLSEFLEANKLLGEEQQVSAMGIPLAIKSFPYILSLNIYFR